MASISTLGIGSGMKLADTLDALQTAEKAALTPITTQQSAYSAKLSAYGTLKNALTAFQTANTALNSASLFSTTKASSSSSAFTATTTSGALAGKYSVSVSKLAAAQTLSSTSTTDKTAALATTDSQLVIKQANGKDAVSIDISASNSSLNGIRDAINKASAGVTASIIQVSSGNYVLSVTSNESGKANAMTISVTDSNGGSGDTALSNFLSYDGGSHNKLTQNVAADDAVLMVNNVEITSSSNTVSNALEGITLTLNDLTTTSQSLTLTTDDSKASSAISNWVTAYNTLQDSFTSLTKYTAVDAGTTAQDTSNGALIGDSTLRTIQTQLKGMLTNLTSTSAYKTLAQIGITSDPITGQLELDSSALDKALAKDSAGIKDMIVGDGKTNGITTTMATNLTSWLSKSGSLQTATDGVSKTLNKLTQKYNETNERINTRIAQYKTQFTALDVMISKLNSTNEYLTNQFDAMNTSTK